MDGAGTAKLVAAAFERLIFEQLENAGHGDLLTQQRVVNAWHDVDTEE